ncbi:hypothetical protein MBLNU459_g3108t1 [Dothideomycetes sp. NU459]
MGVMSAARGLGLDMVIYILAVPIFLFTLFPLISATSNRMSGIYIMEVDWQTLATTRFGYYGICLKDSAKAWVCTSTAGTTPKSLSARFGEPDPDATLLTGFDLILSLQRNGFVALLTAAGLAWILSLVLATLVALAGVRAGRLLRFAAKLLAVAAFVLAVASAWGVGIATAAIAASEGSADRDWIKRGDLLLGLQWVAAVLVGVHAWAVCKVADVEGGKVPPPPYYLG